MVSLIIVFSLILWIKKCDGVLIDTSYDNSMIWYLTFILLAIQLFSIDGNNDLTSTLQLLAYSIKITIISADNGKLVIFQNASYII